MILQFLLQPSNAILFTWEKEKKQKQKTKNKIVILFRSQFKNEDFWSWKCFFFLFLVSFFFSLVFGSICTRKRLSVRGWRRTECKKKPESYN